MRGTSGDPKLMGVSKPYSVPGTAHVYSSDYKKKGAAYEKKDTMRKYQ
jgi:hypothetical protein